ncbi:hypothetical protein [Luteitalea sp.]|uniref:hypothetical protein n=1 Tax=Luteitalea sp. TaxID=2004800 RepID=UPI0037C68952
MVATNEGHLLSEQAVATDSNDTAGRTYVCLRANEGTITDGQPSLDRRMLTPRQGDDLAKPPDVDVVADLDAVQIVGDPGHWLFDYEVRPAGASSDGGAKLAKGVSTCAPPGREREAYNVGHSLQEVIVRIAAYGDSGSLTLGFRRPVVA